MVRPGVSRMVQGVVDGTELDADAIATLIHGLRKQIEEFEHGATHSSKCAAAQHAA